MKTKLRESSVMSDQWSLIISKSSGNKTFSDLTFQDYFPQKTMYYGRIVALMACKCINYQIMRFSIIKNLEYNPGGSSLYIEFDWVYSDIGIIR